MKKFNLYYGKIWIDEVEQKNNSLFVKERFIKDASFILNATSLKDALHVIKDKCVCLFGENILIGVSEIYCNDKHIDWNYKNRVTYNDSELKEKMWC